ncbi:prolyl 4-hydroxylase subunit alpha-1-like [Aplysia californica]|uniref:Prolyl 4-hydroxylase subunit alpha-1-like n=1 Tax=Aplysia californica TaxID=6500 RepID=A0ABM1VUG4_APLCA|nr:prolyl 4-hydroxylase subunit alpha-1-like [Aplysia californica]
MATFPGVSTKLHWFLLALVVSYTTLVCQAKYLKDDRFMSDVNLEHYYVIEENVLSHADILLRDDYFGADEEEDEEEHIAHAPNLTEFRSIVTETKAVHREAGPNLQTYLSHPINMYHMFRRLSTKWKEGLDLLLTTTPCKKWNIPSIAGRLQYLRDNLPGEREVARAVARVSLLQRIHGLSAADVTQGKFGDLMSLKPLTPQEQFEIIGVLREQEDMQTALAWLEQVNSWMVKSGTTGGEELGFNRTHILLMMASAHYLLKNIPDAFKATEDALKLDPDSVVAKNNLDFFKEKLSSSTFPDDDGKQATKYRSRYERSCAKTKRVKASRKKCTLTRVGLTFLKTEVIRRKPRVVLFHDVVSNISTDVLKNYAHKTQTDKAWVGDERYVAPDFRVSLHPLRIRGSAVKRKTETLRRQLQFLAGVLNVTSDRWGTTQVVNVGLDGMHFSKHDKDLGVNASFICSVVQQDTN